MRIISLMMGAALALSAGVALSVQVTRPPSSPAAAAEVASAPAAPTITLAEAGAASVMPVRQVHTVPIIEPKPAPEPEPAAVLEATGLRSTIQDDARLQRAHSPDRGAVPDEASATANPALAPAPRAGQTSEPKVSAVASSARTSPAQARKTNRVSRRFHAPHAHREPRVAANPPAVTAGTVTAQPAASPPTTSTPRWRTLSELFGR